MTKHLTIILAFLMTIGTQASSQDSFFFDHTLTAERVKDIGSIYVTVSDEASMGCWTNLKEAREYAEEKLRIKGIKVDKEMSYPDAQEKRYQFIIHVGSQRLTDRSSPCVGAIDLNLVGYSSVNGIGHLSYLGEKGVRFMHPKNANTLVIDHLKETFDTFP